MFHFIKEISFLPIHKLFKKKVAQQKRLVIT